MINKILKRVLSKRLMVPVFAVSLWLVCAPRLIEVFISTGAPIWFPNFIKWIEVVSCLVLGISMFALAIYYISYFYDNPILKNDNEI
jgi:hypothetical protein